MRARDVRWREGRAFSLAYNAGPDALAVAEEAYRRFSGENALSTDAFPSLKQIQAEVVAMAGVWLGATPNSAGFMTSGGTESILMAVKAARDRLLAERQIRQPNMVLPTSAHAAFAKAGVYFGVEVRRVAVRTRPFPFAPGVVVGAHVKYWVNKYIGGLPSRGRAWGLEGWPSPPALPSHE